MLKYLKINLFCCNLKLFDLGKSKLGLIESIYKINVLANKHIKLDKYYYIYINILLLIL